MTKNESAETVKIVKNMLRDGVFGLATYKENINKYPIEKIKTEGIPDFEDYFLPFVMVNGVLLFQRGAYEADLSKFTYLTYNFYTIDDIPSSYIITHLFDVGSAYGFTDLYHKLVNWERYHETQNKPMYVSNLLPRLMTKKEIEEALGYSIIIAKD